MSKKNLEYLRKSIWIIIMVMLFFVPLIVTLRIVPVPESLQMLYNTKSHTDLFAYAKAQVLQVGVIIALILTGIYQFFTFKKEDWKLNRTAFILLGIFATTIIVSYILSEQKELAWIGMIDRYEGTLTWLCYIALTYIIIVIIKEKKEGHGLIFTFVISASIVAIIGAFQWFGIDFFKTDLGMRIMLGSRYEELVTSVNFNLPEGRVYSTLYNPNYVGTLVALVFPLTIYSFFVVKKWWIKPILILLIIPQMIALIGSQSTGGIVAVGVSIVLMGVYLVIKYPINKWVYVGLVAMSIVGYIFLTQMTFLQSYYDKIMRGFQADPETYISTEFESVEYDHPQITYTLKDGSQISIVPVESGISVTSDGSQKILREEERLIYRFENETYLKQIFYNYNEGLIRVNVRNLTTELSSESGFNYYYAGQFSVGTLPLDDLHYQAEPVEWFENERLMSNRGYIWNRTVPRIFERPIFGYGADTFTINFPQGDLIYKRPVFYNHSTIVDKPHNMFLGITINFGFVGLITFMTLTVYSMIKSQKSFLILPVLTYFVVGLVNDSVVFGMYMIFIIIGVLILMPRLSEGVRYNDSI